MAFDDKTLSILLKAVTACRNLLTEDFDEQLRGRFGIYADEGRVLEIERLPSLNDTERETARLLRERIDHLAAGKGKQGISDAVHRIRREQAFTVLNRFAALRMAEERGVIRPSVGSGFNSNGFRIFKDAAGGENAANKSFGEEYHRYLVYLDCLFDELSLDLGVLFDRTDAMGLLFPSENGLRELFAELNSPDVAHLWSEDETVGWIYQYYNDPIERKEMRKHGAPRNSRELAVRNQFFTPRYVVEFLTDNTLGRIWYEMCRGQTRLKDQCRYLVRRPTEIFLAEGETAPNTPDQEGLSQEELLGQPVHIPHRPLKDPREIRLLDPACGSMHFGLYAFDLFEVIYEEVWDKGYCPTLNDAYPSRDEFLKDVPRLIIEHNIHGVDIDPRAAQIAGLSLWLRAQKAWKNQQVKPAERPQIRRSNIVCAEPMPGSPEMLDEFVATLDPPLLGDLVKTVFDKMQLAGEAGSLLKIEEEIRTAIDTARKEWLKQQDDLLARKDASQEEFFDTAEQHVIDALRAYAEQVDADSYQRRLFSDDAARGFAFIDLCRKRYDAVVMNPPFGEASERLLVYLLENYTAFNRNLLCAFIARTLNLGNEQASIGAIYDRTALVKSTYEEFRLTHLLRGDCLQSQCDLGWEVLDANVETTASVICVLPPPSATAVFIDVRSVKPDLKGRDTLDAICAISKGNSSNRLIVARGSLFRKFPNAVVGYDFPTHARRAFSEMRSLSSQSVMLYEGHTLKAEVFFRYWWEVPLSDAFIVGSPWQRLYNGGEYQRFVSPLCDACLYGVNGTLADQHPSTILRNLPLQQKGKLGFGKRGEFMDAHVVPPGFVSTVEGKHVNLDKSCSPFGILALLNSHIFQSIINLYCGQHKYPGYVGIFPAPELSSNEDLESAAKICEEIYLILRSFEAIDEVDPLFFATDSKALFDRSIHQHASRAIITVSELEDRMNEAIAQAYQLSTSERVIVSDLCARVPGIGGWASRATTFEVGSLIVSYAIGAVIGRWDIRFATGDRQSPGFPDPFAPLPVCPPGMLQNAEGLPAEPKDVPSDYPMRISWPGILVDDESHPEDIVARAREAIEVIWKDFADANEAEICEILEVKAKPKENLDALRVYFRDPNRFFKDHLARYSKSRRKAPIYWPLSTDSGSYTLWVYYHRLNRQTLFTCIEMIDLKREDLGRQIESLRSRSGTGGSTEECHKVEDQVTFLAELKVLRERLLEVTNLSYHPNLNDGVQITAAPLWQCIRYGPWQNELKHAWSELAKGEYDWAHLAMSIWPERVVPKCAEDRSLAIAHGINELLWVPDLASKKKDQYRPIKSPDYELSLLEQAGYSKQSLVQAAEDHVIARNTGIREFLWVESPGGSWRRRTTLSEEVAHELACRKGK